tara:strand:+ start:215 stop:2866 length:2652 start_codon:yes stop_codon:yes gene_type:complete
MTRFTAAQFAAAAAAGPPRQKEDVGKDEAWHAYQAEWLAVFWPDEQLPAVGDKARRLRWKAAIRQHAKIEAARTTAASLKVALVPAPRQPPQAEPSNDDDSLLITVVKGASSAAADAAGAAASHAARAGARPPICSVDSPSVGVLATPAASQHRVDPPAAEELARAAAAGRPPELETDGWCTGIRDRAEFKRLQTEWLQNFIGPELETRAGQGLEEIWNEATATHKQLRTRLDKDATLTAVAADAATSAATDAANAADAAASKLEAALAAIQLEQAATTVGEFTQLLDQAESASTAAASATAAAEVAVGIAGISSTAATRAQKSLAANALYLPRYQLQVSTAWRHLHAPAIESLKVSTPLLTPMQQHAVRRLRALGAGPDGEPMVRSDVVRYSLPPADGESKQDARRRNDRHLRREQNALGRINRILTHGDAQCVVDSEAPAVQAAFERFQSEAEALRDEAGQELAAVERLNGELRGCLSYHDRQSIEAAAKQRAADRAAAVKREQQRASEQRLREQAEASRPDWRNWSSFLRNAPILVAEMHDLSAPSLERSGTCWGILSEILKTLHEPRIVVFQYRLDEDIVVDFGLAKFANMLFCNCMLKLRISLDVTLLSGCDASGHDSFYVCLREYRDVLRVHQENESLLTAELTKAAADPDYILPPRNEVYSFPLLNDLAAAAAALTYNQFDDPGYIWSNSWDRPKWEERKIWWCSELQHEYDLEQRWRSKSPHSRILVPANERSKSAWLRHWAWVRRNLGTDRHLSLQQSEVLCDALLELGAVLESPPPSVASTSVSPSVASTSAAHSVASANAVRSEAREWAARGVACASTSASAARSVASASVARGSVASTSLVRGVMTPVSYQDQSHRQTASAGKRPLAERPT